MPKQQDSTGTDSVFMIILSWVIDNVVYGCIPLICACIFRFLGKANIDLLKITPDCLLVGFAISISAKSYIEEFDESAIPQKNRRVLGSIPFITCIICCILYAGLFGEFSVFNSKGDAERLKIVLYGLAFAIVMNIGDLYCLHKIREKTINKRG